MPAKKKNAAKKQQHQGDAPVIHVNQSPHAQTAASPSQSPSSPAESSPGSHPSPGATRQSPSSPSPGAQPASSPSPVAQATSSPSPGRQPAASPEPLTQEDAGPSAPSPVSSSHEDFSSSPEVVASEAARAERTPEFAGGHTLQVTRDDPRTVSPAPSVSVDDDDDADEDKSTTKVASAPELRGFTAGPLTAKEESEMRQAKAAYASFWSNLKFKKGWDTPLFLQSEVDDLLDQAAEIVARIRCHLDKVEPGFKMRMMEGNAHEYLWTQKVHPRKYSAEFVRELVHQTLRDANGYVEGLSETVVNMYIDHIQTYWRSTDEGMILQREVQRLRSKVSRQWRGLVPLCNDVFTPATPGAQDPTCTIVQLATLRELNRALTRVQYHVSVLLEERSKRREARGRQATVDAEQRFEEQVAKRSLKPTPQPTEPVAVEPEPEPPVTLPAEISRAPSQASEVEVKFEEPPEEDDPEDPPALKKIEQLVQEVNVRKSELDRMKGRTSELEIKQLADNPLQSQKTLKSLHDRCKYLSLELERDLLKLDSIVGGSKVRPMRKAQVRNIQHMLEDVDSINEKLSGLETALLPAVEEEQEKLAEQKKRHEEDLAKAKLADEERKREEANKARQAQEEKQRELQEKQRELQELKSQEERQRATLGERWKQLKLQPKWDIQETRLGYQVSAYIPGMRKEDLEISASGNTITLAGTRVPTAEEEAAMGQVLQAKGLEIHDQNLLRSGAGRFGRFHQQYSLPTDADVSGIKATYDAGIFQVVIPRKVVQRPVGYGRGPGGGFFDDRDFWW